MVFPSFALPLCGATWIADMFVQATLTHFFRNVAVLLCLSNSVLARLHGATARLRRTLHPAKLFRTQIRAIISTYGHVPMHLGNIVFCEARNPLAKREIEQQDVGNGWRKPSLVCLKFRDAINGPRDDPDRRQAPSWPTQWCVLDRLTRRTIPPTHRHRPDSRQALPRRASPRSRGCA